jgi:hypothetical protein
MRQFYLRCNWFSVLHLRNSGVLRGFHRVAETRIGDWDKFRRKRLEQSGHLVSSDKIQMMATLLRATTQLITLKEYLQAW